jgi:Protein of unknown function (DUF2934)
MKPITTMALPLSTTNQTTESADELREEIRHRAHELYEQRDRVDGLDWFQAETEILRKQKQRKVKAASASK